MDFKRFKMLKRFFHIAPPTQGRPLARKDWAQKLQPLSDILQHKYQQYLVPATPISVDEMMVRFTGRSVHTTVIKGKPTPEGYKIFALCEKGYIYSFLYTSRVDSFTDLHLEVQPLVNGPTLCKTSRAVLQMCLQLPYNSHRFILYCDNYFSNIPLFTTLRQFGIAACGTARPNSGGYPHELKVDKRRTQLPWGTLIGAVRDDVLALLWQDKVLVRFLTTAFPGGPDDIRFAERRRPRITRQNQSLVNSVWGDSARKLLPLPAASVEYNLHMGGVDIADQKRCYYSTQLQTVRNWMPIFYWQLDSTIINALTLSSEVFKGCGIPILENHRRFRIRLAWNLVLKGSHLRNPQWAEAIATQVNPTPKGSYCPGVRPRGNNSSSRSSGYVTKRSELPPLRHAPGTHNIQRLSAKSTKYCFFCRFLRYNRNMVAIVLERMEMPNGWHWHDKIRRTAFGCSTCQVPLCREFCHRAFHMI